MNTIGVLAPLLQNIFWKRFKEKRERPMMSKVIIGHKVRLQQVFGRTFIACFMALLCNILFFFILI